MRGSKFENSYKITEVSKFHILCKLKTCHQLFMRAKFVNSPVPKISLKKLKNCTKLERNWVIVL